MPFDLKFDPVTRDLIPDGRGSFVTTQNADTMLMHQMLCVYQQSWHDENLGSLLGVLQAYPQGDPVSWAIAEAKRALGVLASRGRISNIDAIAEEQGNGRIAIATTSRDVSTGQVLTATAGG